MAKAIKEGLDNFEIQAIIILAYRKKYNMDGKFCKVLSMGGLPLFFVKEVREELNMGKDGFDILFDLEGEIAFILANEFGVTILSGFENTPQKLEATVS